MAERANAIDHWVQSDQKNDRLSICILLHSNQTQELLDKLQGVLKQEKMPALLFYLLKPPSLIRKQKTLRPTEHHELRYPVKKKARQSMFLYISLWLLSLIFLLAVIYLRQQ
ncbi:MAG: hypothetical protein OQK73_10080 [Gammaproteobacteria bacterium]|nr:hypothetical protein [Gammaproteobacteria bacterium]